ncbi:Activator of stress genes protein 1 [Fusarium acuminatum]|uniref:Activator of stress genes protein 1 n=1 Tax=Fusarium acuminatum TaxID=5515 RepID=A0ABZ2X419_9HYPO
MAQARESRGVKKSNNQTGETGKRRTPYALVACDACRRRKGKCDGRQPCRYCAGRKQNCSYSTSFDTDEWQAPSISNITDPAPVNDRQESVRSGTGLAYHTNQAAIVDMLANLQSQLNNLASQVQSSNQDQANPRQTAMAEAIQPHFKPQNTVPATDQSAEDINDDLSSTAQSSRTAASQTFYGPTCPEYALNVGQLKLRRNSYHSLPLHQRQLQLASIHEDETSDGADANDGQDAQFSPSPRTIDKGDPAMLLTFRSIMGLQEAIKLLYIYQEVVGELHPVVDIDALIVQTQSWYADAGAGVWDVMAASTGANSYEMLLIINLCLAIALSADSRPSNSNTERLLVESFQGAVNGKLAAPANSIKHATIIFLKVKNPYLKAMLSFVLISDRFSEPISKAAKGEGYNDESSFELMSFQIEQWRKKAVGNHSIAQCHTWQTDPSTRPPTWAILLNLRAESVRSQILKPFFFSELDIEITKNHVRPATERVYDIIHVLHTLDATTDLYRKQHPFYQHILACTAGLAFLLMAFIKQNRDTMLPSLTPDLVESLGGSFSMCVALTTKYTSRSRAARRLAKRLIEMRRNLLSLGILDPTSPGSHEGLDNVTESIRRASLSQHVPEGLQQFSEYSPPFETQNVNMSYGMAGTSVMDTEMQMGWEDSLRLQWPIGDVNHMFSESIF